jgi:hypothetical protein
VPPKIGAWNFFVFTFTYLTESSTCFPVLASISTRESMVNLTVFL